MYIIEERTKYILLSKEVSADEEDAILDVSNIWYLKRMASQFCN